MAETFAQREPEAFVAQLADLFQNGGALKDAYGYTEEHLEAVYALGYNLYNQGKFGDALKLFGFLLMHDHLERRYYKAFGSCLHMLKRYEEAIRNYSLASILDLSDPEPTFHTAECFIALGMPQEAVEALGFVVTQTKDKPDYQPMYERSKAMLELLAGRREGGTK